MKTSFPRVPQQQRAGGAVLGVRAQWVWPTRVHSGTRTRTSISVRDSALRPPSTLQPPPGDRVCAPSLSRRHHFHGEHRSTISSTPSSNTTDSQVTHCRLTCSSLAVFPEVWQLMPILPFRVSPEELIKFGMESGRGGEGECIRISRVLRRCKKVFTSGFMFRSFRFSDFFFVFWEKTALRRPSKWWVVFSTQTFTCAPEGTFLAVNKWRLFKQSLRKFRYLCKYLTDRGFYSLISKTTPTFPLII